MKMKLRKIFTILTMFILLISIDVFAQNEIEIELNGKMLQTDVAPIIENNRTMVPLRVILEALGAKVEWNATTKTAQAKTDKYTLIVPIGSVKVSRIDNTTGIEETFTIDTAAQIKDGRTLVPVRFMAELLDKKVIWDNVERNVIIVDSSYIKDYLKTNASNYYECLNTPQNNSKFNDDSGKIELSLPIINNSGTLEDNIATITYSGKRKESTFDIKLNLSLKAGNTLKQSLDSVGIDLSKVTLDYYMDDEILYINSNLFSNKALVEEMFYTDKDLSGGIIMKLTPELKEEMMLDVINETQTEEVNELIYKILIESINTKEDYDSFKQTLSLVCKFLSNENFVKTETGYKLEYKNILDVVKVLYSDVSLKELLTETPVNFESMFTQFALLFEVNLKNNMLEDSKLNFKMAIKDVIEEGTTSKIDISSVTSKKDTVNITKPNTSKAVSYEELMEY